MFGENGAERASLRRTVEGLEQPSARPRVYDESELMRMPMHSAHPYRFQAAQRSEVMAPTVPISSRPPF
jgi:hypothetical protein